jgi:hypothetical protein
MKVRSLYLERGTSVSRRHCDFYWEQLFVCLPAHTRTRGLEPHGMVKAQVWAQLLNLANFFKISECIHMQYKT